MSHLCNVPSGSSAKPYGEARSAEFDGTGGTVIKSVLSFSSYFVGMYIKYIPTYIHVIKDFHQHSSGFQNLMSSWGWGNKISKLPEVRDFSIFGSKLVIFYT